MKVGNNPVCLQAFEAYFLNYGMKCALSTRSTEAVPVSLSIFWWLPVERVHLSPMPGSDFFSDIWNQLSQTKWPEIMAVVFGIASVLLASRNHILLYPTGIISTAIYTYLMLDIGLYAESGLYAYYLVMSIYGWYVWLRGKPGTQAGITVSDTRDWITATGISGLSLTTLYFFLSRYTDSEVPLWDAAVSALAYAGMWLLARHKLENWLWLNASNALAIPLYLFKGIPFTALLTVFLFVVAIFGYLRWRKAYFTPDIHQNS